MLPLFLSISLVSETENLRLASPVISAAFQCDNCTTVNLSTPVNVTFKLTPYDQVSYHNLWSLWLVLAYRMAAATMTVADLHMTAG